MVPPGDGSSETFASANAEARFKIRLPIHKLQSHGERRGDVRMLARGAVCETRPREELEAYAKRLRAAVTAIGATVQATRGGDSAACSRNSSTRGGAAMQLTANLGYAAKYDKMTRKRYPSATDVCDSLRLHLLALEEDARAPAAGMMNGTRWLYLFNDRPPTVSALMGKKR
jgi:hypothetical protein